MPQHDRRRGWYEPDPHGGVLTYLASALLVLVVGAAAAEFLAQIRPGAVASDVSDAVMIDLPPALASPQPRNDALDGVEQPAGQAAPPTPPAPPPEPIVEPPPEPPPEKTDSDVAVEKKTVKPPDQKPATPAPAQEEQAPSGDAAPGPEPAEQERPAPAPDSRAITAWQRALVRHLEATTHKRAHVHLSGTVVISFRIDEEGRLVERSVARSSGDPNVDATGLSLIVESAPFPRPPAGLGDTARRFTVPVRINPPRR